MNTRKGIECEQKRFGKLINYRLYSKFMNVGIAIAVASIMSMLLRAYVLEGDTEWLKLLVQKTLLIGLLIMSISKDKEEDEMTITLRSQSYAVAFVIGVVYALLMPYVEFGVGSVVKSNAAELKNLGDFQVLLFMLMIQLLFYHNLKRFR